MAQTNPPPIDPSKLTDANMDALKKRVFSFEVRGADVRTPLTTSEQALSYAEGVIRATELTSHAYEEQAPYTVEDRGETWWVVGASSPVPGLVSPLHVELRKSDAAVVSYGRTLENVRPAPPVPR